MGIHHTYSVKIGFDNPRYMHKIVQKHQFFPSEISWQNYAKKRKKRKGRGNLGMHFYMSHKN